MRKADISPNETSSTPPSTRTTSRRRMLGSVAKVTVATTAAGALVASQLPRVEAATNVYNVKMAPYNAAGDGVTDDTTAIANALSAANSAGGGCVYFPAGTYLTGPQSLYSFLYLQGDGPDATIIKLKNGANADLFSSDVANINLSGASGAGSSTAITLFGISDMTLDGNNLNQTAGPSWVLRFYGYGYTLSNLHVRYGYTGGIQCDYNGTFPTNWVLESTWINVRSYFHNVGNGIGIEMGGPHDSRWTNVLSYHNGSHSVHIGPNCGGLQAIGCHAWQSGLNDANSCTWLQEASMYAAGCEAEGSPNAQLVLLANGVVWTGGSIYAGNAAGVGIQFGQAAGGTPFTNSTKQSAGVSTAVTTSSYFIDTLIQNIRHTNGAIYLVSDSGGVLIARVVAAFPTDVIYTGTFAAKTTFILNAQGYTSGPQQLFQLAGSVTFGQVSGADPGNNGTINTVGNGVVLLYPATSETGLILQPGTIGGQTVWIVNEHATNTLTFAASGTSHVADGTSDVIQPNTARGYVWSTGTNRWYRMG